MISSGPKTFLPPGLRDLALHGIHWDAWAGWIERSGITIDRPRGTRHPEHPSIIYPIDYGYVQDTVGTDGHEIDIFIGTSSTGLVGSMITLDYRKGDTEFKLLFNCTPEEIYLVNGFINFDRSLMDGVLVLRRPMAELWKEAGSAKGRAGRE